MAVPNGLIRPIPIRKAIREAEKNKNVFSGNQ
jgi:hypothetical protein